MSTTLILLAGLAAVMAVLGSPRTRSRTRRRRPFSWDFFETKRSTAVGLVAKEPFTATEAKFFRRLVEALPNVVVVPQMAMGALVDLDAHTKRGRFGRQLDILRSSFSQKRVDFVLLDGRSLEVVCVVELDDYSHDGRAAKAADAKRDALLASVGYTTVRFDCRKMPTAWELRRRFLG